MKHTKPAQVYQQLEITALSSDGRGIAKLEGMVVFVQGAITGDIVDAQVTRKKSGYREARPIHFHQRSEKRIDPTCSHFGVCGGCTWQSISYAEQLLHKQQTVTDALRRIGKMELPEIDTIMGAPEDFYYRNKLEFTFSASRWLTVEEIASADDFTDRRALGFHIPGRFDKILHIDRCYLQDETSNRIRLFVRDFAMKAGMEFYHPIKQEGYLRNMIIRNTIAGEWMVVLSATRADDQLMELLEAVKQNFPEITSLMYTVNTKKNDVWYDLDIQLYSGLPYLEERMEDLRFRIGPKSFYQTNPVQAERLYGKVRELAGLTGEENVYDLYTGTGTIALFLSKSAKHVTGVEYVEAAVEDAKMNAVENSVGNVSFFAGDMKDVLVEDFFTQHGKPDVIITDPPRAGMHADVVMRIVESGAKRVVYVSCNPSTQARDLALMDEVYKVMVVQPVDMFPQTTHVENIVMLERR
jgi:23S rRNA (uracil1939-C5)-methyltransferase